MVYVEHDINSKHKDVLAQEKDKLVFNVEDACESDMFTDKDISLQKISFGDSTHWVALVKLDSSSKYGYLQSQLAQCKNLDYMPQTSINVKVEIKLPKHCFNYKCLRHEKVCEEYIEESTYEECILTLAYGNETRTETKSCSNVCMDWERKCRHEPYGRRGYNGKKGGRGYYHSHCKSFQKGTKKNCNRWGNGKCLEHVRERYVCGDKRVPFKHHHTKRQLEYAVDVVGQYSVETKHKSRRRLLWSQRRRC